MSRSIRTALLAGLTWMTGCASLLDREDPQAPPNIVLIMSDDQGYGDFGFTGNPVLETPHLDALATTCPSVRRFYVSPVCSPTRACLLTGRYNHRTRVIDTYRGRSCMEPEEVTLAEALKGAGYRTGIFGKWHLGDSHPLRAIDQGFDRALVHKGGGLAQPSEPLENERRYTDPILFQDGEPVQTRGFCTDVYFDAAMTFIDESLEQGQPFFAYIPTNAPHGPFHDVPEELYRKYEELDLAPVQVGAGTQPDRIARIYAMIENLDQNVGRLLAHLDDRGIERDTIVVFLSDNGPEAGRFVAGLRGGKGGVHEGGIRTPLLFHWPGHVSPGTTVEPIAAHIDLFPTLLDAAGVEPPVEIELDGRSLLPLLRGEPAGTDERHLVIQSHRGDLPLAEHHFAVIGQRFKLVRASGFGRQEPPPDHPFELYDLRTDPGEQCDLADAEPGLVTRLRRVYADWFEAVSSTREDNYAPPRIVPGTAREPTTILTRQDWRGLQGGGWADQGMWPLHLEQDRSLDVSLRFREKKLLERVIVHLGETRRTLRPQGSSDRFDLGPIEFPAGDVDFRIECVAGAESFAPYQVTLIR